MHFSLASFPTANLMLFPKNSLLEQTTTVCALKVDEPHVMVKSVKSPFFQDLKLLSKSNQRARGRIITSRWLADKLPAF